MGPSDRICLVALQDFLMDHVIQDATAAQHHKLAESLYAMTHLHVTRPRPQLARFLAWREGKENSYRGVDVKVEMLIYQGLFPARIPDLLAELLS
jgi:hypothetical protein